jgi:hypothetical protein
MAYRCPVCEEPQVDAGHLANHLAFTAVIRGGAHEDWLDEHVPGWGEDDEDTLAERLLEVDEIAAVEHPIDASSDDADGHSHDHGHQHGQATERQTARGPGALDADAQRILDEAQALTRQMEAADGEGREDGDTGQEDSEGETE